MNEPLWMPKGSVRSLLALGLVGSFLAITGYVLINLSSETLADLAKLLIGSLTTSVGTVITLYFSRREEDAKSR